MKVTVFVQIIGKINSRELWELVQHLGDINVTDCVEKTLVYGECYLEQASRVIFHCALFGDCTIEINHERSG